MSITRLVDYSNLLLRGSIEFQIQIKEDLAKKEHAVSILKSSPAKKDEIALQLTPIAVNDVKLCQRVDRWIRSRDKKTALRILKESIAGTKIKGLDDEVYRIVDLSKREEKQIKELLENCENQLVFLERAKRYATDEFIRKYNKLVNDEKDMINELVQESNEANKIKSRIIPFYRTAFGKAAAIAAGTIPFANSAFASSPIGRIGNPANPASPLNPRNMDAFKRLNTDTTSGMVVVSILIIGLAVALIIFADAVSNLRLSDGCKKLMRRLLKKR